MVTTGSRANGRVSYLADLPDAIRHTRIRRDYIIMVFWLAIVIDVSQSDLFTPVPFN